MTREDISVWFDEAVKAGATHMFVVFDSFDYDTYPINVMPGEDARAKSQEYSAGLHQMQILKEVYSMKLDKESQLNQYRAFNFD